MPGAKIYVEIVYVKRTVIDACCGVVLWGETPEDDPGFEDRLAAYRQGRHQTLYKISEINGAISILKAEVLSRGDEIDIKEYRVNAGVFNAVCHLAGSDLRLREELHKPSLLEDMKHEIGKLTQ